MEKISIIRFVGSLVDLLGETDKLTRVCQRIRYGPIVTEVKTGALPEFRVRTQTTDLDFDKKDDSVLVSRVLVGNERIPYSVSQGGENLSVAAVAPFKDMIDNYLDARGPLNYDAPLRIYSLPQNFCDLVDEACASSPSMIVKSSEPVYWNCAPDNGDERDEVIDSRQDRYLHVAGRDSLLSQALYGLKVMSAFETSRNVETTAWFKGVKRQRKGKAVYIFERIVEESWVQPVFEKIRNGKEIVRGSHLGHEPVTDFHVDRIIISSDRS